MKTIKDIDLSGKRVLCRVDFNVPLDDHRQITDDARIRGVMPTLAYILSHGGALILASHLGRPKGKVVPEMSLLPAAKHLEHLLGKPVKMAPDCIGAEVSALAAAMAPGEVLLLENLRFHAAEQKNDDAFAAALAGLCDVYVNDAFAVSHRADASVEAITRHAPVSAAGFLLEREMAYFKKAMAAPQRPLVAVIGGAKVSSKLAALNNMLDHVDKILIGGAMANTFLKAKGLGVGKSKVEEELIETAAAMMKRAAEKGIHFYLPVDAVTAAEFNERATIRIVPVQEIPVEWMMLDIGPATSLLYAQALYDAKTIVWNGPMGVFEMAPFSRGTMAMASSIANAHALTIVGGGDTDAALHQAGETDRVSYVSTGGGAFLSLLEGNSLPAVSALEEAEKRSPR
ncbi:MAG: phosphoglycerate kinase [Pseudomonadota bacterium]